MRKMRKLRHPTKGLGIVLAAIVGFVAATWGGAIWLEEAMSIPAHVSLGLFFGAWGFIEIIKWINRVDDPRHAKRPPDAR
jgi:hypothetical protein